MSQSPETGPKKGFRRCRRNPVGHACRSHDSHILISRSVYTPATIPMVLKTIRGSAGSGCVGSGDSSPNPAVRATTLTNPLIIINDLYFGQNMSLLLVRRLDTSQSGLSSAVLIYPSRLFMSLIQSYVNIAMVARYMTQYTP